MYISLNLICMRHLPIPDSATAMGNGSSSCSVTPFKSIVHKEGTTYGYIGLNTTMSNCSIQENGMLMCNVKCGLPVMRQSPLVFEPYGGTIHRTSGCDCARSYLHFGNYTIIHYLNRIIMEIRVIRGKAERGGCQFCGRAL